MGTKVGKHSNPKQVVRLKRKKRIRSKLAGTAERPRLAIYRSNKFLYAQIVDDTRGHTLVAASSGEKELGDSTKNLDSAKKLGELLAKRALAKSVKGVVFDRGGYLYHGRIKALADAAREAGLLF